MTTIIFDLEDDYKKHAYDKLIDTDLIDIYNQLKNNHSIDIGILHDIINICITLVNIMKLNRCNEYTSVLHFYNELFMDEPKYNKINYYQLLHCIYISQKVKYIISSNYDKTDKDNINNHMYI